RKGGESKSRWILQSPKQGLSALKEAIVDLVILDQRPISIADEESLRRLLPSTANKPDLSLPRRNVVGKMTMERRECALGKPRGTVIKNKHVAATSDIWTANNGASHISLTV
ncbi:unnamed protein product, partial [Discosporangium mesarthrocarpum]